MHCGQDCAVRARPEQPGVADIYIVRQGHLPSGERIHGSESRNTESPNETADPTARTGEGTATFSTVCRSGPNSLVLTRRRINTDKYYVYIEKYQQYCDRSLHARRTDSAQRTAP